MVKHLIGLAALLAMVVTIAPQARAVGFEVAVGSWQQSFGGTLGYDEILDANDILSIDNDFNFDKENRIFGRVKIDMPLAIPNIYIVAAPMKFQGTGTKTVEVDYGNIEDIPVGATLDSEITIDQYDIALYWGIPFVKMASAGKFNIDVGLNVRLADIKARLRATALGFDEQDSADISVPIPMVYLACQIMPVDAFAIELEGRGIAVGDNKLYSLIGRARYNFTGPMFVAGGYRYDKLEIDEDDILADIDFSGPFLEVGLKF